MAKELWLRIHQQAAAYLDEGGTTRERLQAIDDEFRSMPFVSRRELLKDLTIVANAMPDLYAVIAPTMPCDEIKR